MFSACSPEISGTEKGKLLLPYAVTMIFLLVAVVLCFPDAGFTEEAASETQLQMWYQWRAQKRKLLESVIDEFNCRRDDVRVIAEPLGPMSGTVAARMLLGSAAVRLPELAVVERDAIPALADAGLIRSVDELAGFSSRLKREELLDSALSSVSYEGKLYGFPVSLNPFVLIYNDGLLSAAGVSEPPRDWAGFIDHAQALSTGGVEPWPLSVRSMAPLFHILCLQKGVALCEASVDRQTATAVSEVLNFIRDLRQTHSLLPPYHKFWDPNFLGVASGRVVFQIDDAAMLASLVRESSTPLAATMVPSDSSPPRTYLSPGDVFVISSSGARDRTIAEFLEFFYSAESYSRFVRQFLFVSP